MRFLASIIIWIVFVGGLWFYTQQRDAKVVQPVASLALDTAEGSFMAELTTTFDVEEDPFALQIDDKPSMDIELRVNGEQVALPEQPVIRGTVLRIENIEGVLNGHNEVYIGASPPVSESMLEHGVRVKIFAGDNLIADNTAWSSSGSLVSDSFSFEYKEAGGDGHEH